MIYSLIPENLIIGKYKSSSTPFHAIEFIHRTKYIHILHLCGDSRKMRDIEAEDIIEIAKCLQTYRIVNEKEVKVLLKEIMEEYYAKI